jgi:flagellum-specific peptidoglycan hydrolase FlgJ
LNKFLILIIILGLLSLSSVTNVTSKEMKPDLSPTRGYILREVKVNTTFIQTLFKSALEVEKKLGIPALFQVAQAIQESGWDITPLIIKGVNSYNFYGIKYNGYDGVKESVKTTGSDAAEYQVYKSYEKCFEAHSILLISDFTSKKAIKANPEDPMTYKKALERYKKDKNLKAYTKNVAIVYAGDDFYALKVLNLIETLKIKLGVKEIVTAYEQEIKEAEETLSKLGIMTDFRQPVTSERLAVILARLIKVNFKSI